jgi:hypothetical protein
MLRPTLWHPWRASSDPLHPDCLFVSAVPENEPAPNRLSKRRVCRENTVVVEVRHRCAAEGPKVRRLQGRHRRTRRRGLNPHIRMAC